MFYNTICESESTSHSVMSEYMPRTVACQPPLPMEFSRQEFWSGLPSPSPGDLPDPGIEPRSLALQADSLLSEPPGTPQDTTYITATAWLCWRTITHYRVQMRKLKPMMLSNLKLSSLSSIHLDNLWQALRCGNIFKKLLNKTNTFPNIYFKEKLQ